MYVFLFIFILKNTFFPYNFNFLKKMKLLLELSAIPLIVQASGYWSDCKINADCEYGLCCEVSRSDRIPKKVCGFEPIVPLTANLTDYRGGFVECDKEFVAGEFDSGIAESAKYILPGCLSSIGILMY